jgi:transcriptional regulator with XRE-family HTH domain
MKNQEINTPEKKRILRNIWVIRNLKGYNEEYMALRLGISQSQYSKIERGETETLYKYLDEIALIFDISTISLILYNENGNIVEPKKHINWSHAEKEIQISAINELLIKANETIKLLLEEAQQKDLALKRKKEGLIKQKLTIAHLKVEISEFKAKFQDMKYSNFLNTDNSGGGNSLIYRYLCLVN